MFQLSKEEFENWKSQFAISNYDEDMSSQFATTSAENMKSQITTSSGEEKWKSQIVISNSIKMRARKLPYAFTENGIAMLSGVLRSQQAVKKSNQAKQKSNGAEQKSNQVRLTAKQRKVLDFCDETPRTAP